jgi:GT2 family glycosyltransferase
MPRLSFIVLSYNYEDYIGTTIRSILDQTVQDFEIVVVDDASRDRSCEVIRGFDDPRIRLLVNERNLGGAGSYNRAVEAACGEWLVNLDADDWIAPEKSEIQLAAAAADPRLDIIGTHVVFVDAEGAPHPRAEELEGWTNRAHALDRVDTWVGANPLCRSSTMVRRAAHLRIGLDDPGMQRAPDYELWTRALREGCHFAVVPERLTFYRMQARGVTHGDPLGTMLEMAYAMLRNLVPLAEARALHPSVERILGWVARHPQLAALSPGEAYRLLGMLMTSPPLGDFASFRASLADPAGDPALVRIGRRCLLLAREEALPPSYAERLQRDLVAITEARDFWHQQSQAWERICHSLRDLPPGSGANDQEMKRWTLDRIARQAYSRFFRSS